MKGSSAATCGPSICGQARDAPVSPAEIVRLVCRLATIVAVVGICTLRLAVVWTFRHGGARACASGHLVGECCETLGPTFIKLAQILSTRPDLIHPELAATLGRLQSSVRQIPRRLVPRLLHAAYGRPVDDVFDTFDFAPLGSGSIAQVHRARLKDGRTVAVKIRRPGVERRVRLDLRLLLTIAGLLGRLPALRLVPLVLAVRDIGSMIEGQLDFVREAESNRRLQKNFSCVELVRIPVLIDELCTPSTLVMEYLPELQRIERNSLDLDSRRGAALRGLRALYQMIFLDGFVHADMHPGNVFVREWGELIILDTGLMTKLDDKTRRNFVDFFFALVNGDDQRCARLLLDQALFVDPTCDVSAFNARIKELVRDYSGLQSRSFEIVRFVRDLMESQRAFRICGSIDFVTTVMAMVLYDGICKQIFPECDFQKEARPFLITARYQRNKSRGAAMLDA